MTNEQIHQITLESLRDWFKKEKWVRISSSGNIAGPCGTSKNKKNPDRCLPKAKAQSLTKNQRAATARKKKKAGAKGKTVVKNTKKATVKKETKGAPKGHYFTKSGNLVKGRLTKDARERGARLSDPKDKQRSKVPPVTQYNEGTDMYEGDKFSMKRFSGPNGIALQVTARKLKGGGFEYIQIDGSDVKEFARAAVHVAQEFDDLDRQIPVNEMLRHSVIAKHDGYELVKKSNTPQLTIAKKGKSVGNFRTSGNEKEDIEQFQKMVKNGKINETSNPEDGKAAPFGSGYKKVNEMTIEDIKNLTVGILHEIQGKEVLMEKDDRCTRIAKRKYDTWPSAYASGAVVRCRRGEIWKKEK